MSALTAFVFVQLTFVSIPGGFYSDNIANVRLYVSRILSPLSWSVLSHPMLFKDQKDPKQTVTQFCIKAYGREQKGELSLIYRAKQLCDPPSYFNSNLLDRSLVRNFMYRFPGFSYLKTDKYRQRKEQSLLGIAHFFCQLGKKAGSNPLAVRLTATTKSIRFSDVNETRSHQFIHESECPE